MHDRFGVGTQPALNFSRARCQAQNTLKLFFPSLLRRTVVVAGMGWISVIAIGFRFESAKVHFFIQQSFFNYFLKTEKNVFTGCNI